MNELNADLNVFASSWGFHLYLCTENYFQDFAGTENCCSVMWWMA
jgi:hypothetical protein